VIVLEVSDFQCPVCKRAYEPLRALADDFPGMVRLVFKQNPLDMHRNAWNAAAASMAAARQGKFDAFADILFQNQSSLDEASLTRFSQQIGLDAAKFRKDYEDLTVRARAKAEGNAATAMGAAGTPAFFVNGQMQVGWASYEAIKQMAQQEIQAVDALMAQGRSLKDARIERVKANLADKADAFLASPLGSEYRQP
jgi:protein-disulfide isomerase